MNECSASSIGQILHFLRIGLPNVLGCQSLAQMLLSPSINTEYNIPGVIKHYSDGAYATTVSANLFDIVHAENVIDSHSSRVYANSLGSTLVLEEPDPQKLDSCPSPAICSIYQLIFGSRKRALDSVKLVSLRSLYCGLSNGEISCIDISGNKPDISALSSYQPSSLQVCADQLLFATGGKIYISDLTQVQPLYNLSRLDSSFVCNDEGQIFEIHGDTAYGLSENHNFTISGTLYPHLTSSFFISVKENTINVMNWNTSESRGSLALSQILDTTIIGNDIYILTGVTVEQLKLQSDGSLTKVKSSPILPEFVAITGFGNRLLTLLSNDGVLVTTLASNITLDSIPEVLTPTNIPTESVSESSLTSCSLILTLLWFLV
jgi:hypothetical protein